MNKNGMHRHLSRRSLLAGGLGAGLLLSTHVGAQDDATHWADAAPMPTPHAFHAATLLPDGSAFVTGGRDDQTALDTTARYDPVADQWTATAPLPEPRSYHAALTLPDGRVFVVGNHQVLVVSALIYDPDADRWTNVAPLPTPYGAAGAALLPDGQVLALTCDPQRYDPASDRWFATGPLRTSGSCTIGSAITTLVDGRILSTGGPYRGGGFNTAVVYDPTSNTWAQLPVMRNGRAFHTATALPDGGALVVGGMDLPGLVRTAERYDVAANRWLPAASPRTARSGHTATLLNDGSVLIVGGVGARGDISPAATAEWYDPVSDLWSDAGMLHPFISGHAATLLATGDVLITGGTDNPRMPTRASTAVARFAAPASGFGLIPPQTPPDKERGDNRYIIRVSLFAQFAA